MSEHLESEAQVAAPADAVFAFLDDPAHLVSHMAKRSWGMAGGRMQLSLDERRGREVGARIRLAGSMLGIPLAVEEEVIERMPPRRKVWQTIGKPRLVAIAWYRMGFEIRPEGAGSRLRVFIDYALPDQAPARWLGVLLGRAYARWCTERMAGDASQHFGGLESR